MKKKGFTMIELLAVFTITAIILLIVLPQMTSVLTKSDNKEKENFLDNIFISCEAYIEDNDISVTDELEISLETLINSGYLKSSTVNPDNNKKVSDNINKSKIIIVTLDEDGIYQFELQGEI